MPREQITFRKIDTTTIEDREVHTERETVNVHVGWNRAGWVQVSLAATRRNFEQVIEASHGEPEIFLFSEVIERGDLNKLIRALRKARDQAYGSDA